MECIITGTVIHGKKLGRSLGFPTANLLIDPSLEIANGVYAGRVALTGKPYGALVNIGYNPTVPTGGKRLLEAHLLDFSGDLYGRTRTFPTKSPTSAWPTGAARRSKWLKRRCRD